MTFLFPDFLTQLFSFGDPFRSIDLCSCLMENEPEKYCTGIMVLDLIDQIFTNIMQFSFNGLEGVIFKTQLF